MMFKFLLHFLCVGGGAHKRLSEQDFVVWVLSYHVCPQTPVIKLVAGALPAEPSPQSLCDILIIENNILSC